MEFFKQLKKGSGGYIFLSHSHEDIQQVRLIRNDLENAGFEPLCFYLKCMDDANEEELWSLIQREIDARDLFILVDSENARNSGWVSREQNYIRNSNKDKILTIDLEDRDAAYHVIQKIRRNMRIFISGSHKDIAILRKLRKTLSDRDFLVFTGEDVPFHADWAGQIEQALVRASQEGCVIVLISEHAMNSHDVSEELLFAINNGGNILPVFLGDVQLSPMFNLLLSTRPSYYLSANPSDEELSKLVNWVSHYMMQK